MIFEHKIDNFQKTWIGVNFTIVFINKKSKNNSNNPCDTKQL